MIRKLVQHGTSTLMVSLPSKWVKKNDLKKGQDIQIIEKDDYVKISSKGIDAEKKKTEIDVDSIEDAPLRVLLAGLYRAGYDEIKLRFKQRAPVANIQKVIDSLFGYEVNFTHETECVINSIIDDSSDLVEDMINKLFLNSKMMFDLVFEDKINKEDVISLKANCQKIRDYCQRMISILRFNKDKSYDYYVFAYNLERIPRISLFSMLLYIIKNKPKLTDTELLKSTKGYLDKLHKLFLKKDFIKAKEFYNELNQLVLEGRMDGRLEILKDKNVDPTIGYVCFEITEKLFGLSSRIINFSI